MGEKVPAQLSRDPDKRIAAEDIPRGGVKLLSAFAELEKSAHQRVYSRRMGHLENLVSQDGCPLQHNRGKLEFFTEVRARARVCVVEKRRCDAGDFEMRALSRDAIGCNLHSFSARCYWVLLR